MTRLWALCVLLFLCAGAWADPVGIRDAYDAGREVAGYPDLRTGEEGTVIIATFSGSEFILGVHRSKGVDPPADKRVLEEILFKLNENPRIEDDERKRTNSVELDYSQFIAKDGTRLSGSLAIGSFVNEIKNSKHFPKPIFLVVAPENRAELTLGNESQTDWIIRNADEVPVDQKLSFQMDIALWGGIGFALMVILGIGMLALPFFSIPAAKRSKPYSPSTPGTMAEMRTQYQQQQKIILVMPIVALPMIFNLMRSAPIDVFGLGRLLVFGRSTIFPYLTIPFLLSLAVGVIAPLVIQTRLSKQLPVDSFATRSKERRVQHGLRVGLTMFIIAFVMVLIMLNIGRIRGLLPGVPSIYLVGGIFMLMMLAMLAIVVPTMTRNPGSEPLPVGHRLNDAIQDIGRDFKFYVHDVSVGGTLGFAISDVFGGRVTVSRPLIRLMPHQEARALIANWFANRRGRVSRYAMILPIFVVVPAVTFGFLSITVSNPGFRPNLALVAGGVFFVIILLPLLVTMLAIPRQNRKTREKLRETVKYTQDPNSLLMALARQASLGKIAALKKGFGPQPLHITEVIQIIRDAAAEFDLPVMAEDPFDRLMRSEEAISASPEAEIIRRFADLLNQKNLDEAMELLSDDIAWSGVQGRESVRAHFQKKLEEDRSEYSLVQFNLLDGDAIEVLADVGRRDVRGHVVGADSAWWTLNFRHGKITRMESVPFEP